MVEQNARRALAMSNRGYVLDLGKDRFEGPGKDLLEDPKVAELYLGGTARSTARRPLPVAQNEAAGAVPRPLLTVRRCSALATSRPAGGTTSISSVGSGTPPLNE